MMEWNEAAGCKYFQGHDKGLVRLIFVALFVRSRMRLERSHASGATTPGRLSVLPFSKRRLQHLLRLPSSTPLLSERASLLMVAWELIIRWTR
jgi:hypothetical protein